MNLEDLLLGGGLVLILWIAGYEVLAVVTLVIFLFVVTVFKEEKSKQKSKLPEGVKISGPAEVLEPVVIEVKRNPPFRIPEKSTMTLLPKGYKSIDREKYSTKLAYPLALLLYRLLGGKKKASE